MNNQGNFPCGENVLNLANAMLGQTENAQKQLHWVLLYESQWDANVPPYSVVAYVRTRKPKRFKDIEEAMEFYCNTPCPASQIIHGNSLEEMESLMEIMDANMCNPDWVEENLAPLL